MKFKSSHKLTFESKPWKTKEFVRFDIGTVNGLYRAHYGMFEILALDNDCPGNGHLNDLFEYFEYLCRKKGKGLRILELWNESFKDHLINKRGFQSDGEGRAVKYYV